MLDKPKKFALSATSGGVIQIYIPNLRHKYFLLKGNFRRISLKDARVASLSISDDSGRLDVSGEVVAKEIHFKKGTSGESLSLVF